MDVLVTVIIKLNNKNKYHCLHLAQLNFVFYVCQVLKVYRRLTENVFFDLKVSETCLS